MENGNTRVSGGAATARWGRRSKSVGRAVEGTSVKARGDCAGRAGGRKGFSGKRGAAVWVPQILTGVFRTS